MGHDGCSVKLERSCPRSSEGPDRKDQAEFRWRRVGWKLDRAETERTRGGGEKDLEVDIKLPLALRLKSSARNTEILTVVMPSIFAATQTT